MPSTMATHLLSLADDILIELLGVLSPSDAISCRKVCRRLHRLSLERSVWLKMHSNCDYTLPEVSESLEVAELERILLRGEIMKDKWTGVQNGVPHAIFQDDVQINGPVYLGTMGPYVVKRYGVRASKEILFVWSPPDNPSKHVFAYRLDQDSKRSQTITHSFMNSNSMRIGYIGVSEGDNEARYSLEVIRIKLQRNSVPSASLEASVPVEDAMAKNVTLTIQHDYALISQVESNPAALAPPSHVPTDYALVLQAKYNPVAVFHIPTAKMVSVLPLNPQLNDRMDDFISPWHLIRVSDKGNTHFYTLPSPEDLSDQRVRLTHEISLPVRGSTGLQFFPRTPARYTVTGLVGNTLVNWDIRLPPAQGEIPTLAEVRASCSACISPDESHRIHNCIYYDVPPSSKTALGVLLVEKGRHRWCEYDFIAFRTELDRTETGRESTITMVKLENMVGPNYCGWLRLRWFDPFNGVVLLRYEDMSKSLSAFYGQRLRMLQYLPARLIT